ncbi:Alpha-L-arabinofuranosidase C-terminus [Chitinophaga jiangningensis]|uniref:non-reducing end alpha-L-arabinofuranosidase n=1 Tax=Chitinophaga jiangningensis TaxID=1419482 RepID=A0A1M7CML7_9BACT|nr:alpha-L-arabinofuranosidase C-terminal domain-containing protein [Chitinophaga jiangningensis]SHL68528.1 Alpha-L-arabinofuranosidase C-terminus [Chitinophaga jiangningensis]
MKNRFLKVFFTIIAFYIATNNTTAGIRPDHPDSIYLFSYSTAKNNNHNGLHFAWSNDKLHWTPVGNEFSYVRCDYGRWGSEKRMLQPFLFLDQQGQWQLVWSLNEHVPAFGHASSADLTYWGRQSYPTVAAGKNFRNPVVTYNRNTNVYQITYNDSTQQYFQVTTTNFKDYTTPKPITAVPNPSIELELPTGKGYGQLHRVPWRVLEQLQHTYEIEQFSRSQDAESTSNDATRFVKLKSLQATITAQPQQAKSISDVLMGVFFEDINYAADGGLYAELIQNRDFEYALSDREYHDKTWNSTHSWTASGLQFSIDSVNAIHENNKHYAVLTAAQPGGTLQNSGFDGINVPAGSQYIFSIFAKPVGSKQASYTVSLVGANGTILASANLRFNGSNWAKQRTVLKAATADANAHLEIKPLQAGTSAIDMVSLFPQNTYKNRVNGLRADLAASIAVLHPRFVRFPGGCVAHGDGLANIYRWKNTIGPLEARKPQRNLWGYHQSAGLGYFEYFQFCEDIGAAPLPVIAAGVPCQNSGIGGGGQQGGIPMADMPAYIQDILDLIEYANGSASSTWGRQRAAAGHSAPFNLKYIGIGNEDLITDLFEERYAMIVKAIKEKYPDITVIGTVGPFCKGTDYEEGWKLADKLQLDCVDEHYYQPPGWFINNQDFYDKYDRNKSKVYLGEYAAHAAGRVNNLESALAEALYLTSVERNGDVVSMASYAPLLAKEGHTQWRPDLIYFNNQEVKTTVNYEVQQLFGAYAGTTYIPGTVTLSDAGEAVRKRFASSITRNKTGDVMVKIVNMLPVETTTSIDLSGILTKEVRAEKTELSGDPAGTGAKAIPTGISLNTKTNLTLAPYSLTVLKFKP